MTEIAESKLKIEHQAQVISRLEKALEEKVAEIDELRHKISSCYSEIDELKGQLDSKRKIDMKNISTIRRFLGVIEGVAVSLPQDTQTMLYNYIEVVDEILDTEEKGREN